MEFILLNNAEDSTFRFWRDEVIGLLSEMRVDLCNRFQSPLSVFLTEPSEDNLKREINYVHRFSPTVYDL